MTAISAAISSIINGNDCVCCICLHPIQEEPIRLKDAVILDINDEDVMVGEVLSSIFDEQMYSYLSSLNSLCKECTRLAISCYKFIQLTRSNAEHFKNILEGITNSFEYTMNELHGSKSLFVSFNLQDFTSKHYYDIYSQLTTNSALKRFHYLDNAMQLERNDMLLNKIKKENETTINTPHEIKKSRNLIDIPKSKMLPSNGNDGIFKCKDCCKEFLTYWNWRNHFMRVHAPKKFKCPDCPKRFALPAYLKNHRRENHHSIVCSDCGKTFHNMHTLRLHELHHNLTLVCQDCGRIYKNKTTFQKHIKLNVCGQNTRANPSEAKLTCDYCNKKYTQKVSLRVHIQYEHGNYKAHVCEWCGKKFWAQSRLKAHIVKHTKEKNFPCSICEGKFVSKESLLYHTRIHTGERPYKCPHCDMRFLSASRRSEHVKRHHLGGTHECGVCHSKFNSQLFLEKHKKTHLKANKKMNFTYGSSNINSANLMHTQLSKNILTDINLKSEEISEELWKISELDKFQNVIESVEVEIKNLGNGSFNKDDSHHSLDETKVYLDVPDDTNEKIKLTGVAR